MAAPCRSPWQLKNPCKPWGCRTLEVSWFPIPTTPTEELAMDKGDVNTKGGNVSGLILGIDLGKYKSVVCVYEPTEPSWQIASFTTNRGHPGGELSGALQSQFA